MTERAARPFIVIGENIHATRVVLRGGPRVATLPDGGPALPFTDEAATEQLLPVPDAAFDGPAGPKQRVKHVKAAIISGMGDDAAAADLGRAYLRAMARRQAAAGASYLDLNVDEVTTDVNARIAAMRWLVTAIEDATDVPLALDSSSAAVLRAGLDATSRRAGAPLLNSAALDRLDVLDFAAGDGCGVVLSATGAGSMPANADQRVSNGRALIDAAVARGLDLAALYVDSLVLPVAVDPEAGRSFLDAVRALRAAFTAGLHLTGGLSNVSYGLPARRLLNDVFIDLAIAAGADSGIIDPLANNPRRIGGLDRAARPYRLASDVLTGADPYGGEFLMAYRAGELA